MMRICSLASSSSGNCIYVGSGDTHILIDTGISCKRVKSGLETAGIGLSDIDAILVTHEHSDHIRGLGVISRKYRIPLYATRLTWERIISSGLTGPIDETLHREITPDIDFRVRDLVIHPFRTQHDAVQPVCFTVSNGRTKIGVATDLGSYDSYISEKLKDSNLLFIEANHDIEMLKNGSYPYYLKKRILSDRGHLSNETSGRLIAEIMHEDLKYVILGHLSKENNNPALAHRSVGRILEESVKETGSRSGASALLSDIQLIVSEREEVSGMIEI